MDLILKIIAIIINKKVTVIHKTIIYVSSQGFFFNFLPCYNFVTQMCMLYVVSFDVHIYSTF